MPRGAKMRLALNAPNRLLLIQIQAITRSMHHKWKYILNILLKKPMEKHRGPTLGETHWVKG